MFLLSFPQPRKGVEEGPARLRKQGLVSKIEKLGNIDLFFFFSN